MQLKVVAEARTLGPRPVSPEIEQRDRAMLFQAVATPCRGRHPGMANEVSLAGERPARRGLAQRPILVAECARNDGGDGFVEAASTPSAAEKDWERLPDV